MEGNIATDNKGALGVILDFVPTNSQIHINQYHDASVSPSISMRLKLSEEDNVTTTDERSLNNIEWAISLYRGPTSSEHLQSCGAIGSLSHNPSTEDELGYKFAEGCWMWAHLEESAFDLLSKFVLSQRLPSSIRVHTGGTSLHYGWEPDGSGKIWDVKAAEVPTIRQLEILLGTAGKLGEGYETEQRPPVSTEDFAKLQQSVSDVVSTKLDRIDLRLTWIVGAVVALAVIVLFRLSM